MSTTSTVPVVTDALLSIDPTKSFEAWPGPEAAPEMLVLGEVTWAEGSEATRIATVKVGRKQRSEFYLIAFELYIMGAANTSPASPKDARDRAFTFLREYEDALAEDVTGNTDFATVQWIEVHATEAGPRVFERGWAYRIAGAFAVHARLV